MAGFSPQKFNLSNINNGQRFENGQVPEEIAFNAPIEGSAYAIEKAEKALEKADKALNFAFGSVNELYALIAYPIGSIYMSINETSPAEIFGGSWERIVDKFLVGAGNLYALGSTGGSADAVVVSHHHTGLYYNAITNDRRISPDYDVNSPTVISGGTISVETHKQGTSNYVTGAVGVDGAGKNIPPYLAVNIWKRVG